MSTRSPNNCLKTSKNETEYLCPADLSNVPPQLTAKPCFGDKINGEVKALKQESSEEREFFQTVIMYKTLR